MIPTFKLRLHSTSNEVTANMVHAESVRSDDAMMVCKKRLEGRTEPVLQQWFSAAPNENVEGGGRWVPVEMVHEVLPASEASKQSPSLLPRPR